MTHRKQVWSSPLNEKPEEQNVLFCAGRDVHSLPMADAVLLPYDLWTNRAHAIMLFEQNIITSQTLSLILQGLDELQTLVEAGKFSLDPQKEDVHINIESFLTEKYGLAVGGTLHTGRSRNDQIVCDMRLFMRDVCLRLGENLTALSTALLSHAQHHAQTVMPGFTHYQPGMVTSWGHWVSSYVQGLARDLERVAFAYQLINRNPLGAAASFGTSWPINRQRTSELLGFDLIDSNTLDCIVSRWENETQLTQTFAMTMNHLSIIAQDLIFLSLPYVGMIEIDESMVTGSSIMPQKKNPDFAEVIKAKASLSHGILMSLLGIQKGSLSGFNRDTQMTKYLVMDVIRECEPAPLILKSVFEGLTVRKEVMRRNSEEGFINAVDVADHLARTLNLPFRKCYQVLALAVEYARDAGSLTHMALERAMRETGCPGEIPPETVKSFNDPLFLLKQRQHQGSPNPESLPGQIRALSNSLDRHSRFLQKARNRLEQARNACLSFQ